MDISRTLKFVIIKHTIKWVLIRKVLDDLRKLPDQIMGKPTFQIKKAHKQICLTKNTKNDDLFENTY